MAYEVEAIASDTTSSPAHSPMREERVVEHRQMSRPPLKAAAPAQQTISKDGETPAAPVAPAETVTLSAGAAALARKEQKFRQQLQEFQAQQKALEAERAEIAELKALKAKLAAKDYSGLEKQIPYDEYTNYLIEKDSGSTPEQQQFKKLEAELESVKKAQAQDVEKRFEAAVQERRKAVQSLVETSPEFSSIKELKMQDAVVQHILDSWEHDNVDLTPEQAAKEVEEILVEKAKTWSTLSKLKSQSTEEKKNTLPPLKPVIKTTTNNMAATGEIKRVERSYQGMSDSERYKEAYRRAQEKLKQGQ